MQNSEPFVVLCVQGSCQARGRSRAGECWSWWLCCTWLCCWAAPPSSTSPWASSWLSPWCLWLPSSHPTYQSNTDSLAIAALYCHLLVKPHSFSSPIRVLAAFILVILSPACTLLFSVFFFQELQEVPVSFQDGWLLYLSVISQGILDHFLYGSLVYPLIALLVYPCWLLFWNILFWK